MVGLVLFPFAVAAAAWQLLPVMLRNDPPTAGARPLALVLLAAGAPLAASLALGRPTAAAVLATLLAAGLLLLLAELATLVARAPRGRQLAVSRPAVALAGAHAALAFALGAVILADRGPEPLGVPFERFLLLHLSVALIGWLTILIAAVGRTLVPMLGLAAASPRRRLPLAEATIAAGLWVYAAGLVAEAHELTAAGIALMAAGLAPVASLFARVARGGRIGPREGPVAHAAVGLAFLVEAAALGFAGALDAFDGRRAAIAAVLLVGLGWAAGVILGHLGKLVSLAGWGSWPPGPRPSQASLYPRRAWQAEAALFAMGVQLAAAGVLVGSAVLVRGGAVVLTGGALLALGGVGETLRRVRSGRKAGRP
ncbi:MAG TPA: hypothetical protein VNK94_12615 [Gaiellaceae bacterium]|nr:hypothetical protein [Gaiellaceae bacterium]